MKQNLRGAFGASIGMFAFVALAVPGHASTKATNTSRTSVVSAVSSGTAAAKKVAKKHCMTTEALSGSRLPQRKCKTIAEWEALGFEFTVNP